MNTECRVSGVVWWLGGGCQNVPFWRLREGSGGGVRAHVRGGVRGGGYFNPKKGGGCPSICLLHVEMVIFDPFSGGGASVTYSNN